MRDRVRQRAMAEAKSHRATAEELRDAGRRVKELEQELLTTIQLQPETKQGENRSQRYSRLLRLRVLRDNFISGRLLEEDHPNGFILAIVMTVAAFMLCGFCSGGALLGLQVLNYKPSAIDTATAFWQNVEQQNYALVRSNDLSPTLRVVYDNPSDFTALAQASDTYYGPVTSFTLTQESDTPQQATLTYTVTRGTSKHYTTVLVLILYGGSWGVNDLGSSLDPSENNSLPPPPTPSSSPAATATATP